MNTRELTLFYDGNCPFCAAEMARLQHWNSAGKLAFVDIAESHFDPTPLGVDMAALDSELHSQRPTGETLIGIDSMLAAYTLVGKGWLVIPLRIKLLHHLLADLYRKFSRN
jgi:predicted DCC family thiol-disulfide oxidoreductase YuxK